MVKTYDIAIASDHAAFELKQHLIGALLKRGHNVYDMGTRNRRRTDYPLFGKKVARAVSEGDVPLGILLCGSGIGMSIAANRFPGVRAALVHDHFTARMAKEHNDANILVLGSRVTTKEMAEEFIDVWLNSEFKGGRHQHRIEMLDQLAE